LPICQEKYLLKTVFFLLFLIQVLLRNFLTGQRCIILILYLNIHPKNELLCNYFAEENFRNDVIHILGDICAQFS